MIRKTLAALAMCICAVSALPGAEEPKLTAEDLIARHLAAIGEPAARAAAKSRGVDAAARFQFVVGGGGQATGSAKLGTEGRKLRFMVRLESAAYGGEDFVSDGSRVVVTRIIANQPCWLGSFFYTRSFLLKEGLFGGVLSTGWPLLEVAARQPKLHYNGLKSINGRELHELKYEPRKDSAEVQIRLYFEPQTYRHVLTIYDALIPITEAQSLNPNPRSTQATNLAEGREVVRESFSDFKTLDGLVLPAQWSIELTRDIRGTVTMRWDIALQSVAHVPIDPGVFKRR